MELVDAAAEAGAGNGAAPGLADDGGTEEAGRVVDREAEEDLLDKVVREHRRRGAAGWRRGHGSHRVWIGGTVVWLGSTRLEEILTNLVQPRSELLFFWNKGSGTLRSLKIVFSSSQ